MNWNNNQDSSMAERQTRDLEVRVRIPVQVQIFLLKFMKRIQVSPGIPKLWILVGHDI